LNGLMETCQSTFRRIAGFIKSTGHVRFPRRAA
jgi:hypothetical protein